MDIIVDLLLIAVGIMATPMIVILARLIQILKDS